MTLIAYIFRKLESAKGVVRQMSKKSPLRRPYNKRHGKRSETLSKSEGEYLYHNDCWIHN